ncbi:hypothetical protein FQN51_003331 [Onygenales sp. PD_10]|nr:hypothetical protein FQN51_003331 [Onygenales sp. PD_10]
MATSIPSTDDYTGPPYLCYLPDELVLEIAGHLKPSLSELLLEMARDEAEDTSLSKLALEITRDKESLSKLTEIARGGTDYRSLDKLADEMGTDAFCLFGLVREIKMRLKPYISALNALSRTCNSLNSVVRPFLYALDAEHQRLRGGGPSRAINHAIEALNMNTLQYALEAEASVKSKSEDFFVESGFWQAMEKREDLFLLINDDDYVDENDPKRQRLQLMDEILVSMVRDGDADVNESKQCWHADTIPYCGPCGWNPVTYAVANGMELFAEKMVGKKGCVHMDEIMESICRGVWFNGRLGYVGVVEMALSLGGDVNSWDEDHMTALHFLAESGEDTQGTGWMGVVLTLLVGQGADINSVDIQGRTPLGIAVQRFKFAWEEEDGQGWAISRRQTLLLVLNLVKLLLEHGADATLVREPEGDDNVISMLRGVCQDVSRSMGRKIEFSPRPSTG